MDIAIEQTFRAVWPDGDASIRGYLAPIIADFAQSNCCDGHYFEEFQSGDLSKLAARIWEAMLFVRFRELGMAISSTAQGPDFLLDRRIYVEAMTPQPGDLEKGGLPKEWLEWREEQACTPSASTGLSGFPCVGGHNGQEGDPLCPDARSR